MYYFNPLTGKYHFSKRQAPTAGDEILFEINEMEKILIEVEAPGSLRERLGFPCFIAFAEKLKTTLSDNEYLTFSETEMESVKENALQLLLMYHSLFNEKKYSEGLEISEEQAFVKLESVNRFIYSLSGLISYLNSGFSICPHPRYIKDFIGE